MPPPQTGCTTQDMQLGLPEEPCPKSAPGSSFISSDPTPNTQCEGTHFTDEVTEAWGGAGTHRGHAACKHTYLDALDALGDDVGMVHGHQRDLDSSHAAHGTGPHACRRDRVRSALQHQAGLPAQWAGGAFAGLSVPPPQAPTPRQARLRRQPARLPGSQERPPPTCAVDHTGRLDGAVLRLHSGHAAYPEVVRPHADATHRAVLDHLPARGAASRAQQGLGRVPTAPNVTGSPPPRRDLHPCSCWACVL